MYFGKVSHFFRDVHLSLFVISFQVIHYLIFAFSVSLKEVQCAYFCHLDA